MGLILTNETKLMNTFMLLLQLCVKFLEWKKNEPSIGCVLHNFFFKLQGGTKLCLSCHDSLSQDDPEESLFCRNVQGFVRMAQGLYLDVQIIFF